jgi:hypothetical protein
MAFENRLQLRSIPSYGSPSGVFFFCMSLQEISQGTRGIEGGYAFTKLRAYHACLVRFKVKRRLICPEGLWAGDINVLGIYACI